MTSDNQDGPNSAAQALGTRLPASLSRAIARLCDFFGYFILLSGIVTVFSAAYLIRAGYSIVPYWDEFSQMRWYTYWIGKSPFIWILAQHNEHRILFYKLLFMVDMQLFRGSNLPMYIGLFCCPVALAVILGYMLHKLGPIKGPWWKSCFGIALYCLFCPSQWENFYWAFQFSFLLVSVWVVTAIVGVLLQKQRIEAGRSTSAWILLISLTAAIAATFTNANGTTVWPVVVAVALMARLPWRLIAVYVAAFACVAPLYLVGYHSVVQHANPLSSIRQPLLLLEYIEKYLGGAVVPARQNPWAAQIGEIALIVAVVLIVRLLRSRGGANVLDYGLAGITLYCVATAFLTSLGRVNFGTDQAFAPRYQTFSLLFWFAVTTWIISIVVRRRAAKSLAALYLLIAVTICSSAKQYRPNPGRGQTSNHGKRSCRCSHDHRRPRR